MRVDEMQVNANGSVDLNLIFESPLLYDDSYNLVVKDVYECLLPDPNAIPPSVTNISVTEDTAHYRGRTFTRLVYDFDVPEGALWSHVEVWRSYDGVDYEHLFNVVDTFNIDNALDGQTYYVKLRSVSLYNVKQTLASAPLVTWNVLGEDENPPPSPLYLTATVNQQAVSLYSDKLADPDIEVYEFRIGATWSGGTYLGSLRAPNMNIPGMKPGEHTFWMNTFGTNKLYGTTPVSATVTLPNPPLGWTNYDTFSFFYNLIDNAYFEAGVFPWTSNFGTLSTAAGGVSGNCLRITKASGLYQTAQNTIDPKPVEELKFYYSFWVKSGTSGNEAFQGGIWNDTTNSWIGTPQSGTSSGDWVQYYGTATMAPADVGGVIQMRLVKNTSTAGYMQFDDVSIEYIAGFQNTEHTIYSGDDYLKCSHGFNQYTSNTYTHAGGQTYHLSQRWEPLRDLDEDQLSYIRLYLQKVGSPTGNLYAYLYPKESGADEPDYVAGPLATSDPIDVSTVVTSPPTWYTFNFSSGCSALTEDTTYFIVIKGQDFTGNDSNTIDWVRDGAGRYGTGRLTSSNAGSTWTQTTTEDHCFAADELVGRWTSRIIDVGALDDYLAYAIFDIVQVGGGNLWSDINATVNTWDQINALTITWEELVQLEAAGRVYAKVLWDYNLLMRLSYDKYEFLSAILNSCEYLQLQITIIDPTEEINMHVSEIFQFLAT
jgi:hypothetical protein